MSAPISVTSAVVVPASAIRFAAVRSAGPGGQNVNKVSSKVELRVDLAAIHGLDGAARARLLVLAKNQLDAVGWLIVTSQRTRDQARNLEDARDKVRALVARALIAPRARHRTRPSRGAIEQRLRSKHRASERKRARRVQDD